MAFRNSTQSISGKYQTRKTLLIIREKCRMLYNSEVRFKNRAYLDFNVTIKKIKLRINLAKLMASPDVYLRAKVP